MGVLTQKCVRDFPAERKDQLLGPNGSEVAFHKAWNDFALNSSNWYWMEGKLDPVLCGNSSGAGESLSRSRFLKQYSVPDLLL
jgi:hypothetical protein